MDRGVWWATIRGVTKSTTQLSKWVMCHKYYSDWCEVKHKQNMGSGSSSVAVMSDSLRPHGLQHASLSITNSWSLPKPHVHWVGDAIQPSYPLLSFSSLQFFPASGSFPMSQFFASGGQSTGVSTAASVLLMNIQDWFLLRWTGWTALQSKELSRIFSNTTVQKHQFSFLYSPTLTTTHYYWKNHSFD